MCLIVTQTNFGQKEDFYDKVLDDMQCMYCSHIAIEVESSVYTGRVTIDNNELYFFLNNTKGYDKTVYKNFVKKLLINKEKLKLDDAFLSDSKETILVKTTNLVRFEIVKDSDEIKEIAAKGKEEFIKHYFRKPSNLFVINKGIKDWNSIINKLFEWQIATFIDDETGFLVIDSYRSSEKF